LAFLIKYILYDCFGFVLNNTSVRFIFMDLLIEYMDGRSRDFIIDKFVRLHSCHLMKYYSSGEDWLDDYLVQLF
jgi:hypothetical protein